jgi:hypothetical protein
MIADVCNSGFPRASAEYVPRFPPETKVPSRTKRPSPGAASPSSVPMCKSAPPQSKKSKPTRRNLPVVWGFQSVVICVRRHRCFRDVGLPIRVGGEGSSCVEFQVRRDRWKFLQIERQIILDALDQVCERRGDSAEDQHRPGVFLPIHFSRFINARWPVQQLFDQTQNRIEECFLPVKHSRHERADQLRDRQQHEQEETDLQPSIICRGQNFSGRSIAYTR